MEQITVAIIDLVAKLIWPAALLWFLWPLRKRLSGDWTVKSILQIFRRWRFKGPGGIEAEGEMIDQQVDTAGPNTRALPPANNEHGLTELVPPPAGQEALVATFESQTRAALDMYDPTRREAVAVRATSIFRSTATHEWIYNRIFGSQIFALDRLLLFPLMKQAELREYYDRLCQPVAALGEFSFESWLGFLLTQSLIERVGEDNYQIAHVGRAFMAYLASAELTKNKMF